MRLSAKVLESVVNINSYKYSNTAYLVEGSTNAVYVQLVDNAKTAEISPKSKVLPDNPLRYISQATALSVTATFPSIDDAAKITAVGTQPFAEDKSIWKFTLTSSQVPASGNFNITVVEDGNSKQFTIINAISVDLLNSGGC